jgi:hypothetical protein
MSVTKKISTGNYNLSTSTDSNVVVTTGTMLIYGNLYVQGSSTTVNVANISTSDPTIRLNSNVSTPFLGNSGIEVYRGTNNYVPALYWNETTATWQITTNIASPASFANISTDAMGSGSVGFGNVGHLPYYAANIDTVVDAGPNLTWNGANLLTVTGNVSTTNLTVNGVNITTAAANSGGTGIYFSNSTSGELVSNTRALALSIIFG